MPILHYQELTSQELDLLQKDKTVIFLQVNPFEAHGPHLPLATDPIQSQEFTNILSKQLQSKFLDWNFIIFPNLTVGCDTIDGTGSIENAQRTMKIYLYDFLKQFHKDGFKKIIALSAHGGPRHLVVLEELAEKVRWRFKMQMISASSRVLLEVLSGSFVKKIENKFLSENSPLNSEEKNAFKLDLHGGIIETSSMLHIRPDLVKPIYKTLTPAIIDKIWKMNRKSGKTVSPGLGYLGTPNHANPVIGKVIFETICEDLVPLLERFLEGKDVRKEFRSKFYYIPFLRTEFKWIFFIAVYATAFAFLWHLMIRMMTEVAK